MDRRNIIVSQSDMERLMALIQARRAYARDQQHLEELEQELERATVAAENHLSGDVVTMNSRVWVTDLKTKEKLEYEIVFPRDADLSKSKISILAPIATALLGYRAGSVIEWETPGGKRKLRIEEVEAPAPLKAA